MAFGPGMGISRIFYRRNIAWAAATWLAVVLPCAVSAGEVAVSETGTVAVALTDTVVVTAGLIDGPGVPSTASLVTRIDLDDRSGFGDLNDVLGSVAGLQVARLGGWGTSAVPSLRGSSPAQIRFLLDGIPLPDAQTGLAGFDRIPLDRLQAVEVHRGTVPVGLGGVGGIGAINFITRQHDEGLDASLQAGSFGEVGARATVGGGSTDGTRSGMIMMHGHRADNDYTFLDHNQTFHRDDDDTVRVRENAWVKEWGAWGHGRFARGELSMRGSLGYSRREGGRPGALGYASPHASVQYDRMDGQLHLDWATGLVKGDLAVGQGDEYLFDPEGEVGFAPPGTTHAISADLYARLAWSPTLVEELLSLDAGFDWGRQRQTETFAGVTDPERQRRTTSAFVAARADLVEGRLRVVPAWRWQHTHDNFPAYKLFPWLAETTGVNNSRDDVSPALGVVWTTVPDRVFVESHVARTVRIPTWIELFGHRGGVDGNRELLPEQITSVDLPVCPRNTGRWSGRAAGFHAQPDDTIIFVQNSQKTSRAINLGSTVSRGLELELVAEVASGWSLNTNVTLQRAENRSEDAYTDGNSLPFLPELEAYARLSGRVHRWRPWFEASHLSNNYRDRSNTELNKAPARTLLNLGVGRDWYPAWRGLAGSISVLAEVINLTDNAVYDVAGFPLPGRSWHLAVRIRK